MVFFLYNAAFMQDRLLINIAWTGIWVYHVGNYYILIINDFSILDHIKMSNDDFNAPYL